MASLRSNKSTCVMIALIGLLSGISSTQISSLNAQSHSNVTIGSFAFSPQDINVAPSDVVTWTNNDPVSHTLWFVIAENQTTYLLSDPIAPEGSWSHTFYEPIRLQYYCLERLWITGNITVSWREGGGGGRVPYAR